MTDPEAWTVQRHLDAADVTARALFARWDELVRQLGPVRWSVTRTAIVAKGSRRGFTGASLRRAALGGYFDLQRALAEAGTDPRLGAVTPYTARLFVHQYRVTSVDQLDDTFAGWLAEAYEVGNGAHLDPPAAT